MFHPDWPIYQVAAEGIHMVIDCILCDTEYHLSEELVREAMDNRIRIRCSRCGFSRDVWIIPSSLQGDEETDKLDLQTGRFPSFNKC